jgi:hypothetical protein
MGLDYYGMGNILLDDFAVEIERAKAVLVSHSQNKER